MAAVLIAGVAGSVRVVIALLLLLVLLNWVNGKIKVQLRKRTRLARAGGAGRAGTLTLSPLSSGSSSVRNSRLG